MTLIQFLVYHTRRMQYCFVIEHFEVSFLKTKSKANLMDINVDYEYLDVVIRYGDAIQRLWDNKEKEAIIVCLAHELTHILTGNITDEMKFTSQLTKRDEQTTEHISRLLYRLYKSKEPK